MNPEFKRYAVLELTLHRLLAMPIILGLLLFLVSIRGDAEDIAQVALWGVGLLSILWGGRQATESVAEEMQNATWDWQRMSTQSPWALTWGKLLGSTIYTWYGVAWCAGVYIVAIFIDQNNIDKAIILLLLTLGIGILVQTFGLLLSLHFARRQGTISHRESMGIHGLLVLLSLFALPVSFSLLDNVTPVIWYSIAFEPSLFSVLSLGTLILWVLVGAYHLMRLELQFSHAPWAWLGFLLFCMVYVSGFELNLNNSINDLEIFNALLVFLITAQFGYLLLLTESKKRMDFHYLFTAWTAKNYTAVWHAFPRWILSFIMTFSAALFLILQMLMMEERSHLAPYPIIFILSLCAFMLRDIVLLLWLNLAKNNRRADMTGLVYLTVLYLILPGIGTNLDADIFTAFFWSWTNTSPLWMLLAPLIQAGILMIFVWQRWEADHA